MAIKYVELSRKAIKDLEKVPKFILDKLQTWVEAVEQLGIAEIRKIPGYHDEPLKGNRLGQRSIRLNRSYRAIYVIKNDKIECIQVVEVNKHEY